MCFPEILDEVALEEIEGPLRVLRALHVEPNETIQVAGLGENLADVVEAERLVNVEPHLRELDRHVDVGAARGESVEHAQVLVASRDRIGGLVDAFAEEIERRHDAEGLQLQRSGGGGLPGFSGHEAAGEPSGHAISPQEVEHTLLLRQPQ